MCEIKAVDFSAISEGRWDYFGGRKSIFPPSERRRLIDAMLPRIAPQGCARWWQDYSCCAICPTWSPDRGKKTFKIRARSADSLRKYGIMTGCSEKVLHKLDSEGFSVVLTARLAERAVHFAEIQRKSWHYGTWCVQKCFNRVHVRNVSQRDVAACTCCEACRVARK